MKAASYLFTPTKINWTVPGASTLLMVNFSASQTIVTGNLWVIFTLIANENERKIWPKCFTAVGFLFSESLFIGS
jgi:hypothetical protein